MKSSARLTVWSPSRIQRLKYEERARLRAFSLSAQDTFLKPPPMQLPSLVLAHGKLVSGPQLGPVR